MPLKFGDWNFSEAWMLVLGASLSSRVRLVIRFLQTLGGDVSVNLCGDKVRVAEQFLDAAQIRAGIQQMGGVAMS